MISSIAKSDYDPLERHETEKNEITMIVFHRPAGRGLRRWIFVNKRFHFIPCYASTSYKSYDTSQIARTYSAVYKIKVYVLILLDIFYFDFSFNPPSK